jgi:hypothetical protein
MYIENASEEEKGDCLIMQLEKKIISEKGYELDLYKHKWLGKNTLLLMIDTSMYDIVSWIYFKYFILYNSDLIII